MARQIKPENAATECLESYNNFIKIVKDETKYILKESGDLVLKNTLPLTPVDTHALRNSGRSEVEDRAQVPRVVVSFGGDYRVPPTSNAPSGYVDYAAKVHEDLTLYHPVGGAKFLTLGGRASLKGIKDIISKGYRAIARRRIDL